MSFPFQENTLVLVKPDGVQRGLIGEILRRFEAAGLSVLALKVTRPTVEFARGHYPTSDAQLTQMGNKTVETYAELGLDLFAQFSSSDPLDIGREIHERNAQFLASGPVVACVISGVHAIRKVRAICGATMPRDAAPGTVRGDLSSASPAVANAMGLAVRNLVHASDNNNDPDEPDREISYWFADEEVIEYVGTSHAAMYGTMEGAIE